MKNLRNYLFLFVFAFTSIMFFSCKTTEECACRAIKEVIVRTSAEDSGIIVRVSNIVSDSIPNESSGIYDVTDGDAAPITYYDNDCNKISTEPDSGVFCVEYSNGKMVKILK